MPAASLYHPPLIWAAATELANAVERWFDYPLLRLGEQTITTLTLVKVIFWVLAVLLINFVFQKMVLRRLLGRTRLGVGLQFAIAKILGYVVVILGCYAALTANGVNLSSLAVVGGALGLGLGFGLQNIVANFVSGIVLLAERPVEIGDRVEVEGVAGQVTRISLRATTIVTNDNISIIVPNLQLTSNPVTNWSHGGPRVRLRVPIGVAYGTEPGRVRDILIQVAGTYKDALKDPPPTVSLVAFGDNALNFELAAWTDTMTQSPGKFRSDMNFLIERAFRQHGIEIPFPQRVVRLCANPEEPSVPPDGNQGGGTLPPSSLRNPS